MPVLRRFELLDNLAQLREDGKVTIERSAVGQRSHTAHAAAETSRRASFCTWLCVLDA